MKYLERVKEKIMEKINIELFLSEEHGFGNILKKFIDEVEKFVGEKGETEQEGWEKIEKSFLTNKLSINEIYDNIEKYGSDRTIILFEIAKLKGLDESDLLDAILKTSDLELTSGLTDISKVNWEEDFACSVPAKKEFDINLNDVSGTIDGVSYPKLYDRLKSKIDPDEVKRIEEYYADSIIKNGIMHIEIPQYHWSLYINPKKLLHELAPKLSMTVDELQNLEKETGVA